MKLITHHITVPSRHTTVSLFPFACVHVDNPGHSASTWREFLDEVKTTPNAYAIGLGDYHDFLRTHAREYLRHYGSDRDSFNKLHDWRKQMADEFCEKYLFDIKDKLIGLSLGNHHHEFDSGYNDTQYMCDQLKVPYLGKGFFLRLVFSEPNRPAHHTLIVLGHHGEGVGGGATYGGDMNAMMKRHDGFDADIYLFSHNHKKGAVPHELLTVPRRGEMKLVTRPKAFIRAGCFMRGYVPNCVTYAEAKLMNPTSIGHVRLDIKFTAGYNKDRYEASRREGKTPREASRSENLRYEFKVRF